MLVSKLGSLRAAVLAVRAQGVAALSTTAAVQQARQRAKSADDVDDFVFKEHCKGTRSVSKEGQEIRDALRRSDFGSLKKRGPAQKQGTPARAPTQGAAASSCRGFATSGECSTDDAAQELTEKGSKRLMSSDDGREELARGSFDVDRTMERVLEEGRRDAKPEARARADDKDVREAVRSRVVSGSQTS